MKKRSCGDFFRKYFLEGQTMDESRTVQLPPDASKWDKFHAKYRKYIAFLIPFTFMHIFWWMTAFRHDFFSLYIDLWPIACACILASAVAGITSEGGGAVLFPLLTIAMNVDPTIARDFCVTAQCFGMTSCLFVVLYMEILIERKAVVFASIGAIPGMIIGFEWLDPLLSPSEKKTFFVSVWGSFAIALYLLNSQKKRPTYNTIQDFCIWKAVVLIITGFVGGIFTAFAGTGIDICTFSIITLLFRVTEKTATPTSVVLMGANTVFASYWRIVQMGDVSQIALNYTIVTIPVAVTVAPLGSLLGSHFHRQVLAVLLYILEFMALVGFLATRPPLRLVLIGAMIIAFGFFFFYALSWIGNNLMLKEQESRKSSEVEQNNLIENERLILQKA